MIIILVLVLVLLFGIVFLMQPKFGKKPSGKYLSHIEESPHYDKEKAAFQNLNETPALTEGVGYPEVLKEFIFGKSDRSKPKTALPTIKTDLFQLAPSEDVAIWFGHSSYFIQLDGKKILVDPVFSGSASPVPFSIRSFKGSDIYAAEDIPTIDYLF